MISAIILTAIIAGAAGFLLAVLLAGAKEDDAYRAGRRDARHEQLRWREEVDRYGGTDN